MFHGMVASTISIAIMNVSLASHRQKKQQSVSFLHALHCTVLLLLCVYVCVCVCVCVCDA